MSYGKFMAMLRAVCTMPPLSLALEECLKISTYALRRFLPTTADRLRIPLDRRSDLGDWEGGRKKEPMAVRYSDARLESAAETRRVCLEAVHRTASVPNADIGDDESVRTFAQDVTTIFADVLGEEWGTLSGITRAKLDNEFLLRSCSGSTSSSRSASENSSSSALSDSSRQGVEDRFESTEVIEHPRWILPAGKKGLLHLGSDNHDFVGSRIPCCRKKGFVFGFEEGLGLSSAEQTGREWSPKCRRQLQTMGFLTD
jgi:hypothetical protein